MREQPVTIHGFGTPDVPRWSVVRWGPLYYADREDEAEHVAAALNADADLLRDVCDVIAGNDYEHVKHAMIRNMVARRFGAFPIPLTSLCAGDRVLIFHKRSHVHPIGVPVPVMVTFDAVHAGSDVYDDADETYISYTYDSGHYETCALYDLRSITTEDGIPVTFEYI